MRLSGAAKAAQDAANEQQRVAQAVELRRGIGWARAELSRLALTPGFGSKTVTVVGGKG